MKLAAVALLLVFIGLTTALPKQVKDRNFEERRTQEWKQLKERIKKRVRSKKNRVWQNFLNYLLLTEHDTFEQGLV